MAAGTPDGFAGLFRKATLCEGNERGSPSDERG